MRKWRIEDSAEIYNVPGWGLKYFDQRTGSRTSDSQGGHSTIDPQRGNGHLQLR